MRQVIEKEYTLKTPARRCTAADVTWNGLKGGQCLNCGGTGPSCFQVKHAPQPKSYHAAISKAEGRGQ